MRQYITHFKLTPRFLKNNLLGNTFQQHSKNPPKESHQKVLAIGPTLVIVVSMLSFRNSVQLSSHPLNPWVLFPLQSLQVPLTQPTVPIRPPNFPEQFTLRFFWLFKKIAGKYDIRSNCFCSHYNARKLVIIKGQRLYPRT